MRVYQNGREVGHLDRSGPLQAPANGHLCLGSFDTQHVAHFTGLLDEVKVWRRALTPAEIAEHARQ